MLLSLNNINLCVVGKCVKIIDLLTLRSRNILIYAIVVKCICAFEHNPHVEIMTHGCAVLPADIDECESNPCTNDGTCVNLVNGFSCNCTDKYNGSRCNIGERSRSV